eukprot:12836993-Alexandrium_andersonii.AAC.1
MATQPSLDRLPVRGDLCVGPPGPEMTGPRSANQSSTLPATSTSRSLRGSARSVFQSPAINQGPGQPGRRWRKPKAAGLEPVGM